MLEYVFIDTAPSSSLEKEKWVYVWESEKWEEEKKKSWWPGDETNEWAVITQHQEGRGQFSLPPSFSQLSRNGRKGSSEKRRKRPINSESITCAHCITWIATVEKEEDPSDLFFSKVYLHCTYYCDAEEKVLNWRKHNVRIVVCDDVTSVCSIFFLFFFFSLPTGLGIRWRWDFLTA